MAENGILIVIIYMLLFVVVTLTAIIFVLCIVLYTCANKDNKTNKKTHL